MYYALIDESGRLFDANDRILVFSVVLANSLTDLEKIVIKSRERIPKKGARRRERLSEIKFSLTGDNTRLFVLEELAKQEIKIYALVIDKEGRKIKDDPINYGVLITELLKKPIADNKNLKHVLIDKHFTFHTQREKFNLYVQKQLNQNLFIEHVDSTQNPVVTIADFVAGAIRILHTKKDRRFISCIEKLVNEERLVTWKQLKSGKS